MTETDRVGVESAGWRAGTLGLTVGPGDVTAALLSFGASLLVLAYGMSATADFPAFLLAHVAVLAIPVLLWTSRARSNGQLTFAALLTLTTLVSGPVGAFGCLIMALTLSVRQPSSTRLQDWYDYIAGIVTRGRLTQIYDQLVSGRLPPDPAAKVPRFRPFLHGTSVDAQQRVLAVIGRRYHPAFRSALRNALGNKNPFIRAQAAAVAARLDSDEKNRIWSNAPPGTEASAENTPDTLPVASPRG
jgi:hypothetical protein